MREHPDKSMSDWSRSLGVFFAFSEMSYSKRQLWQRRCQDKCRLVYGKRSQFPLCVGEVASVLEAMDIRWALQELQRVIRCWALRANESRWRQTGGDVHRQGSFLATIERALKMAMRQTGGNWHILHSAIVLAVLSWSSHPRSLPDRASLWLNDHYH